MKLSMLQIVSRAGRVRDLLKVNIDVLGSGELGAFAVSVNGQRQDDAMHAIVKPVIERELRARLASLDRDLKTHGVEIDAEA